jgi:hypothetical protein
MAILFILSILSVLVWRKQKGRMYLLNPFQESGTTLICEVIVTVR